MLALRAIFGTLAEMFQFMWRRKLWWLTPMVVVLLLFAGLIIFAGSSGLGPFIYTLF